MNRFALLFSALLACANVLAQARDQDVAGVESAVRAFHEALRGGDVAAVERLLAPDAVVLEEGHRESREEYLKHHVRADIEFAQAVPSRGRKMSVHVSGDVAWVNSTGAVQGVYRGQPVNLVSAELVVLSRTGAGWQIRAIHWSSRKVKPSG